MEKITINAAFGKIVEINNFCLIGKIYFQLYVTGGEN